MGTAGAFTGSNGAGNSVHARDTRRGEWVRPFAAVRSAERGSAIAGFLRFAGPDIVNVQELRGNEGRMSQVKGHGEERSREQEQFIAALLSCPTVEGAAETVGIGNVTASQWRKDPAFAERYREATREAMRQAAALLQGAAREAVGTLRAIQSKGESEAARVSAARAILEMAVKAADLEDVQQRLDALEQSLKERETR